MMLSPGNELDTAQAEADDARRQLASTMVELQTRLNPRALVRDMIDEVRETGVEIARATIDAAKRNPAPLLGVGAAVAFFVAQRWLGGDRDAPENDGDTDMPTPPKLNQE